MKILFALIFVSLSNLYAQSLCYINPNGSDLDDIVLLSATQFAILKETNKYFNPDSRTSLYKDVNTAVKSCEKGYDFTCEDFADILLDHLRYIGKTVEMNLDKGNSKISSKSAWALYKDIENNVARVYEARCSN